MERFRLHVERVLTIDLDQVEEELDVIVFHERMEIKVAPPVLVNVAEVARSGRIIARGDLEGVVVPFHIAMLAAIDVIDFTAIGVIKKSRETPAEVVVEIALLHVFVEERISGLHRCRRDQTFEEIGGALNHRVHRSEVNFTHGFAVTFFIGEGTIDFANGIAFARSEFLLKTCEGAGEFVLGLLIGFKERGVILILKGFCAQ
ncbi:MAG: hypothetical protein BWY98_01030 [Tenericutes bacterium ADurb.BinA155]|nr:MAG: hypothetical protein BWY98_01030 [Tenericutes bacterium ADurb.BinA155]